MVLLVCAYCAILALPNVLPADVKEKFPSWMPVDTVPLGLDLRGGSHLLLELDFDRYMREHMMNMRDQLRSALRKERIGYLSLQAKKDHVSVKIRQDTVGEGVSLDTIFRSVDPDLQVKTSEGVTTLEYTPQKEREIQAHLLQQSIEIVDRRVNETGTKEPIIQRQGTDRIIVQVPGLQDPSQLKNLLGKTAKMNFHLVNESITGQQVASGAMPSGTKLLVADGAAERLEVDGSMPRYPVYSEIALSGELLINANATYQEGQPIVDFTFNSLGARKFGEITQANIGKRFAVVLDNKVITAPVIRSAILGGRGIIEGNFTVESANELAMLLRAGALPAPLNIIEERSVGPSLGQDSIDAGTLAAIVGTTLVMFFMLMSYGLFGIFANIALMIHLLIIVAAMSLLQITLTLPGIAGIVLTMGMAVDANVLIYERIRDEVRVGRSPASAIEHGFKIAFGTILDSNITTLIAAALLYYYGAGTVKGFAVTLSIGILSTIFASVMICRMIIYGWARNVKPKRIPI